MYVIKVVGVTRGAGIFQPSMDAVVNLVRSGQWVHIFPEGTRSRTGKLAQVRPGVARWIQGLEIIKEDIVDGRINKGSFFFSHELLQENKLNSPQIISRMNF